MKNENDNNMLSKEEDGQEEEEFREEFQCCVCLDLLYKPIVLGCGHLSCFWCVYRTMNTYGSQCPICRHPYNHFPSVCQLLHFLLLKIYPVAYKRREREIGEEEKRDGYFSPQFNHHLLGSHPSEDSDFPSNSAQRPTHPQTKLYSESCFSREMESSFYGSSPAATVQTKDNIEMPSTSSRSSFAKEHESGIQQHVSVADLLCAKCKKLLFRPVVLNCGHVYCESCIIIPTEGIPRCQICQSLHPNGFPSVCLILEHFLEDTFSETYVERREGSSRAQRPAKQSAVVPTLGYPPLGFDDLSQVHSAGCDSCGVLPIIGVRYKCKDCVEKIGFDLCKACYDNPSKVLGRFNQQHKPDHSFEVILY